MSEGKATTDYEALNEKIKEAGLKKYEFAELMGMSYKAWRAKVRRGSEFKITELARAIHILQLSEKEWMQIFFGQADTGGRCKRG